jgi:hypothetical protein
LISDSTYLLDKPKPLTVSIVYWSDCWDGGGIEDVYESPVDAWAYTHLQDKMTGLSYLVSQHDVWGSYQDKVWLVIWSNYGEYGVEKVFTEEEDAKKYIRHRDKMTGLYYSIEEVEVFKKKENDMQTVEVA